MCNMEQFGRLESSEKTIAILRDRWYPQTAKRDGDRISKQHLCHTWEKRDERPNVGGVSIRSRNGAPSQKGCVINDQLTKASNKCVPPPPPPTLVIASRSVNTVRRPRGSYIVLPMLSLEWQHQKTK